MSVDRGGVNVIRPNNTPADLFKAHSHETDAGKKFDRGAFVSHFLFNCPTQFGQKQI